MGTLQTPSPETASSMKPQAVDEETLQGFAGDVSEVFHRVGEGGLGVTSVGRIILPALHQRRFMSEKSVGAHNGPLAGRSPSRATSS